MSDWKHAISHLASDVESHFDRLKNNLSERLYGQHHEAAAQIVCYRGYGNRSRVIVRGRVFRAYHVNPATEQDTIWRNLLNMYRRFESDEYPYARLEIHLNGQIVETVANDEGFFYVEIEPEIALVPGEITYTAHLKETDHEMSSSGTIHMPSSDCKRGIISDIDDTVIHTHVTHLIKMAQLTFLGNAFTRLPLAGVAAFYRALQTGTQQGQYPIFYVTNSPWNLHDLLVDFFRIQKIPRGIFFMQDFGFRKGVLLKSERHKHDVIIELLTLYPEMDFILIGDSGEHDGHTYRDIVRDYRGRILAIYIRDVDPDKDASKRDKAMQLLIEEVQKMDVDMLLVKDTMAAAEHALAKGFIQADALSEIAEEIAQRSTLLEQALEQLEN